MKVIKRILVLALSRLAIICLTLLTLSINSVTVLAQGTSSGGTKSTSVDISVNKGGEAGGAGMWYTNWWVWAIIVLLFIIIIVAITNRGRKEA